MGVKYLQMTFYCLEILRFGGYEVSDFTGIIHIENIVLKCLDKGKVEAPEVQDKFKGKF